MAGIASTRIEIRILVSRDFIGCLLCGALFLRGFFPFKVLCVRPSDQGPNPRPDREGDEPPPLRTATANTQCRHGGVVNLPPYFGFAGSLPFGLSNTSESLALNGYWRTDCWPVVFRLMSTLRLVARTITLKLASIFWRSSGVRSGFWSISCFTWGSVRLSSLPSERVSMLASGTPCSTR